MENLLSLLKTAHNINTLLSDVTSFEETQNTLSELVLILNNDEIKDNKIKVNALKLMYGLDKDFCKEVIINFAYDKNPSLRRASCGMLSFYPPDKRISEVLENVLRSDPEVEVRLEAVFSLSDVGVLSSIKTLEWAKENDHEENWENRSVSHYAENAVNEIKLRNL